MLMPLNNIVFSWQRLSKKEKRIILDVMEKDDIESIKEFVDIFDAIVLTIEVKANDKRN